MEADTPHRMERLAEIGCMATLLTDQLLEDQTTGRPVYKDETLALLKASTLLASCGRLIQPRSGQSVKGFDIAEASEPPGILDEVHIEEVQRLAHSLRPLQAQNKQGV